MNEARGQAGWGGKEERCKDAREVGRKGGMM